MDIPTQPPVGHLIAYEYLWRSQAENREDGTKTYPSAVLMTEAIGNFTVAFVLGISHSEPHPGQRALEFPLKLKRHLGLDDEPAWIYTDEMNVFVWPGPDLRPADRLSGLPQTKDSCVIGRLPNDFFDQIKAHVAESRRLGKASVSKRTM